MSRNQAKLDMTIKVDISFRVISEHWYQSLNCSWENWHYDQPQTIFDILSIFYSFLICKLLSHLATREAIHIHRFI